MEDHLARYRLADLFLDTFPYNGHTTCSDVLMSGLPFVTIAGDSFSSRVASSILFDIELTELATGSFLEYKDKALSLANNSDLRRQLQTSLKTKLMTNDWPVKPAEQVIGLIKTLGQIK